MKVLSVLVTAVLLFDRSNVHSSQVILPSQEISTSCKTSTGELGKCYPGFSCPNVFSGLNKLCPSQSGGFSVCCPLTSGCGKRGKIPITFGGGVPSLRFKRSSLLKKQNALDNEVAIVGGIISYRNSWPWMVLLGRRRGASNIYFCSGVLLNQNYVITAAHCVLEPGSFFARFGEHDYNTPAILLPPEDIDVEDVIFHPKYKVNRGYYDMALLKLSKPIAFRNEVKPVCLPWGNLANEDLVTKKVTVTGWGSEEFGGRPSRVLREVVLEVFDPKVCEESYSGLPDFVADYPEGMNKTTIVCAGDAAGGKDTCQGDSGGPMVHEGSNGLYNLAGIVSKGYGCGLKNFPGIYTPLRNHETLLWINNTAF